MIVGHQTAATTTGGGVGVHVSVDSDVLKLVFGGKRQSQFSSRLFQHGFSSGTSMQSERQRKERNEKSTAQKHGNIFKLNALFDAELQQVELVKKKLMNKQISLAYVVLCHYSCALIQASVRGFLTRTWFKKTIAAVKIYKFICQYLSIKKDILIRRRILGFFKLAKLRIKIKKLCKQAQGERRAAQRRAKFLAAKAAATARSVTLAATEVTSSSLLFGVRRVVASSSHDISPLHERVIQRLIYRYYRRKRRQLLGSQFAKVVIYILRQKYCDRLIELPSFGYTSSNATTKSKNSKRNESDGSRGVQNHSTDAPSFITQMANLPITPEKSDKSPSGNFCNKILSDRNNSFVTFVSLRTSVLLSMTRNARITAEAIFSSPLSPHLQALVNYISSPLRSAAHYSQHNNIIQGGVGGKGVIHEEINVCIENLALPSWMHLTSVADVVLFAGDLAAAGIANPDLFDDSPPPLELLRSYVSGITSLGKVKRHLLESYCNRAAYAYSYDISKRPPPTLLAPSLKALVPRAGMVVKYPSEKTSSGGTIDLRLDLTKALSNPNHNHNPSQSGLKEISKTARNYSGVNSSSGGKNASYISSSSNSSNSDKKNFSNNVVVDLLPTKAARPQISMSSARNQAANQVGTFKGKGRHIVEPNSSKNSNNINSSDNNNSDVRYISSVSGNSIGVGSNNATTIGTLSETKTSSYASSTLGIDKENDRNGKSIASNKLDSRGNI